MDSNNSLKFNILVKEFETCKLSPYDSLSKQNLYKILDRKIHKEFNRDVGDQLFEKIRIQSNGLPSVMDFIKIYLEAEAILLQKISACQYNLENLIYQKDLQIMKLQTLKNNPTIDPSMTNSILKVVILEAQNLKPLDWKIANNCFAFLNCNGFVYKTKAATSTNPRWNETCEFPIQTGMESLNIIVKDISQSLDEESIGQTAIPINQIQDQELHHDWINLYDSKGGLLPGKILIETQWLFSSVKYHNELRSKVEIENQIIELHDDLTNFENDLAYLYQPFPNLLELAKKNISIKLLLSEQDNETPKTPTTKYIFEKLKNRKVNMLLILAGLYFFFCIAIFWVRALFLDFIICSSFWILTYFEKMDAKKLTKICILTGFSWILDLAWVIIYTNHWWNGEDEATIIPSEISLLRIIVVLSFFLLVIKISFLCYNVYILSNLSDQYFKNKLGENNLDSYKKKTNQIIKEENMKHAANVNRVDY